MMKKIKVQITNTRKEKELPLDSVDLKTRMMIFLTNLQQFESSYHVKNS